MCIVRGDSKFIDSNCKAEVVISSEVRFLYRFWFNILHPIPALVQSYMVAMG